MFFPRSAQFSSFLVLATLSGCVAEIGVPEIDPAPEGALGEISEAVGVWDHTPVAPKELFVTDLSVVNDPKYASYKPGKWNTDAEGGFSFGRLIDNLSPVEKPTDLQRSATVVNWLRLWETPQSVNGQLIEPRPLIREKVITPWTVSYTHLTLPTNREV